MKKTIKTITLIRLLQVFALAIFTIMIVIGLGYRSFFQNVIETQAFTVSSAIKAGLTSHMKAGIMDKKDYFLDEIKQLQNIEDIRITNTHQGDFNKSVNVQRVLDTKKHFFQWNDIDGQFKAAMPYIANSEGTLNCLSCHQAQEGDVLGVIEMTIDINADQKLVVKYGYYLVALFIFFTVLILANLSGVIEKYISIPLSRVINDGEKAYETNDDLDHDHYQSKELAEVAKNINSFNQDILSKQEKISKQNAQLIELNEEIESTLRDTMMAMGEIEEIRSEETKHHTIRVSKLSALIAARYGLSDEDVKLIELASPLHDIGKVAISDAILKKPSKLTAEEYELMKKHATLGYGVLKHSPRKALRAAAQIAYSHHEKWNGQGYPQGLKGEEIPVFARIVAIVDVIDALLCKRIYKEAWPSEDVKALLLKERGEHFEEKLADIVLENFDEYESLIKKFS